MPDATINSTSSLRSGWWWIVAVSAACVAVVAGLLFYHLARSYALQQVEARIRDVMLESRSLHWYVQHGMHPALYEAQAAGLIPAEFYAPEILSSSYITRNVYEHYNELRREQGLPEVHYKLAAIDPRNDVNRADAFEESLIELFREDRQRREYRDIVERDGKSYLLYATPFLAVEERCLKCHGTPEGAPQQLRERYRWTGGFNRKVGDVFAAEVVYSPLEGEFAHTNVLLAIFLAVVAVALIFFLGQGRLRRLVDRYTAVLRRSEERFRILFEQAAESVVLVDPETLRIVDFNDLAPKSLGYTREEFRSMRVQDLEAAETSEEVACHAGRICRQGEDAFETRIRAKNGEIRDFLIKIRRVSFAGKDYLQSVWSDVTVLKRIEADREKLITKLEAQNAELERFAYTVSHDLKTPLITIKGYLGLLQEDLLAENTESACDDMTRISNAADKMGQLLEELLELARIGRMVSPPEDVPLSDLAREAVELVDSPIRERGVEVSITPGLPIVRGDRSRLLEVLQNLIENAVKNMGDERHPKVEIGWRPSDDEAIVFVRDNGIGIASKFHEKIFGLFDKLDNDTDGTGIGLALVRRIIDVHGGRVWVESEGSGRGSTFCFTVGSDGAVVDGEVQFAGLAAQAEDVACRE